MSTPAQVTEAHRELARRIMFEFTQAGTATASDVRMAAQIIADSEAQATAQLRLDRYCAVKGRHEAEAERDQLRAQVALDEKAKVLMLKGHFRDVDEMTKLRAEVERLKATPQTLENAVRWEDCERMQARAERAEAEVKKLTGFYNEIVVECGHDRIVREYRQRGELLRDEANRRKEAEAELANIRALANRRNKRDHVEDTTHQLVVALDQALDIAQAELAEKKWLKESALKRAKELTQELAAERARLDWLESKCPILWSLEDHATGPYWLLTDFPGYTEETASQHKTARAAIDAAMKEGDK